MKVSKLKSYLAERQITLKDFALSIDKSEGYLSAVINGHVIPGWKTHRDIFEATGGLISVDFKPKRPDYVRKKKNEIPNFPEFDDISLFG